LASRVAFFSADMHVGVQLNVMSAKRCSVDVAACLQTFASIDVHLGHSFSFRFIIQLILIGFVTSDSAVVMTIIYIQFFGFVP